MVIIFIPIKKQCSSDNLTSWLYLCYAYLIVASIIISSGITNRENKILKAQLKFQFKASEIVLGM